MNIHKFLKKIVSDCEKVFNIYLIWSLGWFVGQCLITYLLNVDTQYIWMSYLIASAIWLNLYSLCKMLIRIYDIIMH